MVASSPNHAIIHTTNPKRGRNFPRLLNLKQPPKTFKNPKKSKMQ
jgi:hypothetical protein